MNKDQLSQEDRLLNFVHEQHKLNIVIDVLNYNGPISTIYLDDDFKPKNGISPSVVSSAF